MSALGKLVRERLTGLPDGATVLTGGIFPEVAPPTAKLPFAVYTGAESSRTASLEGDWVYTTETVDFVAVANTRAECEAIGLWFFKNLGSGSWADYSTQIHWWKVDSHGDVSEVLIDGSDDVVRQIRLSIVGAVARTEV